MIKMVILPPMKLPTLCNQSWHAGCSSADLSQQHNGRGEQCLPSCRARTQPLSVLHFPFQRYPSLPQCRWRRPFCPVPILRRLAHLFQLLYHPLLRLLFISVSYHQPHSLRSRRGLRASSSAALPTHPKPTYAILCFVSLSTQPPSLKFTSTAGITRICTTTHSSCISSCFLPCITLRPRFLTHLSLLRSHPCYHRHLTCSVPHVHYIALSSICCCASRLLLLAPALLLPPLPAVKSPTLAVIAQQCPLSPATLAVLKRRSYTSASSYCS